MTVANSPCDPEPGTPSEAGYMNEKAQPACECARDGSSLPPRSSRSIMAFFRYALLVVLLFMASISTCYVAASPPHRGLDDARRDPSEHSAFSALLSSASDASLHDVLHECVSGKHELGVYPEDSIAIEAARKEDADAATGAKELAKRQAVNSNSTGTSISTTVVTTTPVTTVTTTTTSPGTVSSPDFPLGSTLTLIATSTPVVFPSPSPLVSPDTESMATGHTESTLAVTHTAPTVDATHTDPPQVSDSTSASQTPSSTAATSTKGTVPVSVSVSAVPTTITSGGSVLTTAIPTTQSATVTDTAAATGDGTTTAATSTGSSSASTSGSTSESTAAGQSSYTSLVLYTTTLPNGARSTYTSTTVIAGEKPTPATATGATSTPALQNSGVSNSFNSWALLVLGILGASIV